MPAYADGGDDAQVDAPPVAGTIFPQSVEELLDSIEEIDPAVTFDRPWCKDKCAAKQRRKFDRADDGSEGCLLWRGWYSRCLIKQKAWPSCACKYTNWHLEGSEWCVEYA